MVVKKLGRVTKVHSHGKTGLHSLINYETTSLHYILHYISHYTLRYITLHLTYIVSCNVSLYITFELSRLVSTTIDVSQTLLFCSFFSSSKTSSFRQDMFQFSLLKNSVLFFQSSDLFFRTFDRDCDSDVQILKQLLTRFLREEVKCLDTHMCLRNV